MCCLWYYQKLLSTGKLSEPSCAEGKGFVGDVAMSVGDLLIQRGIPYVAKKKGLQPVGIILLNLCVTPNFNKKLSVTVFKMRNPRNRRLAASCLTSYLLL